MSRHKRCLLRLGDRPHDTGDSHDTISDQAVHAGIVLGRAVAAASPLRPGLPPAAAAIRPSATPPPPTPEPAPARPHHPESQEEAQKQSASRIPVRQRISRGLCDDLRAQRLCRAIDAAQGARPRRYANVANLIGYSCRKLGDYRLSQTWYERALKSDPNHVLTWQYYGLWQIEQGNRDSAQYHLSRIAAICGTACEEYRSLAAALEQAAGQRPRLLNSPMMPCGRAFSSARPACCLIRVDGYRQPGDSNI